MQVMTLSTGTCPKTGCDEPRAKGQTWCKKHRAEYQRRYHRTAKQRLEIRVFKRGVEAMRQSAIQLFGGMPTVELNGRAVAAFLEKLEVKQV
jgi:hypothetical protein